MCGRISKYINGMEEYDDIINLLNLLYKALFKIDNHRSLLDKDINDVIRGLIYRKMDLVTDFKQIIKDKINDTFEFLNTIYKNLDQNDSDNKDIIREINKSYILISIWRNNFSDDKNIALIDNILLNYCSLTHAILLKDNKVINFYLEIYRKFFKICK